MIKIECLDVEAYAASWIEITQRQKHQVSFHVEAYAASWIEIQERMLGGWNICRRGLRSLVDWNFQKPSNTSNCCVEAYAASWIEIQQLPQKRQIRIVEAYAASWIEIPENEKELSTEPVEAYAASWIEIYSQYL